MIPVVLATRNAGKARELEALMVSGDPGAGGLRFLTLADWPGGDRIPEVEETEATFEGNAALKALAVAAFTGQWALADDSGLCVEALSGAPGVDSAVYASEAGEPRSDARNNDKLLAALAGVPEGQRSARFVCVLALCSPDGELTTVRGEWPGRIATALAGTGGFGYDPLFIPEGFDVTAAALDPATKNAHSHRARALAKLRPVLGSLSSLGSFIGR